LNNRNRIEQTKNEIAITLPI